MFWFWLSFIKQMNLPIKTEKEEPTEPGDYFITSKSESETVIGTPNDKYSRNRYISLDEISNTGIKQEPVNDINNKEYDEYLDDDSETERTEENRTKNSKSTKKPRAKTTRAQFQKLIAFMRCHSDFNKGKPPNKETAETLRIDDAWNILIAELNAIGPPIRTSPEWRRAWTNFKSNKRRRQAANEANGEPSEGVKRMRFETCTLSDHYDVLSSLDDENATNATSSNIFARTAKDEDVPNLETNNGSNHFHSDILKKLDLIVEQTKSQTDQLEKLNRNLQKLIEIVAVKFP